MGRLDGKTVLVTGVGRSICERTLPEGGQLAATDVDVGAAGLPITDHAATGRATGIVPTLQSHSNPVPTLMTWEV
jgi:NAD(P)-dependent dehydrogenase (short-subunit alcohol dehydrogenase family)